MDLVTSLLPTSLEGRIILILVVFSIGLLELKYANDPTKMRALPSLYTIIGVLGTFIGIAFGLAEFDVAPGEIENSVGTLLEGLKSAFLTSILGIIAAISIRYRTLKKAPAEDSTDESEKVISLLEENNLLTQRLVKSITDDDDDKALSNQIKRLRVDLVSEFRDFAKEQSKNNMEALIEAIETVIGEFNVKINEQFGENFKKLNEAVGKLLDWQENYYKQIEYMVDTIQQTNVAVDASSKVISDISDKYQKTYKLTEEFQGAISILNEENKSLQDNVENFAKLSEKASEAFPVIEKNLNELTDGFTRTIIDSLKTISDSHTQQTSETASMMEKLKTDLNSSFEDANKNISGIAQTISEEVKNTIQVSNSEIKSQLTDLYSGTLNQLQELQKNMANDLNQNILKIDESLGNALTNSLNSMSSQLATLSNQFVSDYQPLTERLREVVRIASELNNQEQQS